MSPDVLIKPLLHGQLRPRVNYSDKDLGCSESPTFRVLDDMSIWVFPPKKIVPPNHPF